MAKTLKDGFDWCSCTDTWDGKSTEAYRQDEEGDGDPSSVGKAHHQQQGRLHTEACSGSQEKPWDTHTHTLECKEQSAKGWNESGFKRKFSTTHAHTRTQLVSEILKY